MSYRSSKKYINAILKSSIIVTIVLIILFIVGSVNVRTLFSYWRYILFSFILIIIQYLIKGVRFYIICKDFLDGRIPLWKAILIRVSSEFFSLVGVSYIGDEAFRIYYLNKKLKVDFANASVIGYIEVLGEVIVAVVIVFSGIIYLIFRNIINLVLYILIIATSLVALFHFLLIFRTKFVRAFVIWFLNGLVKRFKSERLNKYISAIDDFLRSFEIGLSHTVEKKKLFVLVIVLTFITATIGGMALWILAIPQNVDMDLYSAVVVLHMSLILSSLPITISGSGLFELVILLSGKAFSGNIPWSLPISFRIASYYLPLILITVLLYYSIKDLSDNFYNHIE